MISYDKLDAHFAKVIDNENDFLGNLYRSREGQKFFAVTEKEAREALQAQYVKQIEKNHRDFLKIAKTSEAPLAQTDGFLLTTVSKYDDSKVDNAKLVECMRNEFGCSEERAKKVIAAARVRPEKKSLIIKRVV